MRQFVVARVKVAESSDLLEETMHTYAKVVQYCVDKAWRRNVSSHNAVRKLCYHEVRDRYGLQAQLAMNATKHASEMIKKTRSKPSVSEYFSIRYNFPRSASVSNDWSTLSLATIKGRRKYDIDIPACYEGYLGWDVRESSLIYRNGTFFFCFTFSREIRIQPSRDCRVLGVDLGVNKVAVTSDGDFYGTKVKGKRKDRDEFVRELQVKGTHATHKRLKERGSRWKRFMTWKNHNISRGIVNKLDEGDVIVMEDLKNIRKSAKYNEWVHKWAFRQLQDFIEYKATLRDVRVVYVDPRNTSKKCNRCHSTNTVRHSGFFECKSCGHTLDADLNGAKNIAQRYTRNFGLAGSRKPAHGSGMDESETTIRGIEDDIARKPCPHEATAVAEAR